MKHRRIVLLAIPLALACSLFLAGPTLRAQDHPTTESQPASEHAEASTSEHAEAAEAEHGAAHEGEHQSGHHGPAVKLFGKELDQGGQFLVKLLNFAIFAGALFFGLKGALSSAFKARAKELEEQLNQAEKDKAEGQAQMKELEAKMTGLQQELSGILAKAETDAEAERQKILEAARAEAGQILAQTQADIEFQKRLAEKELRALVAQLAVEGAAKSLEAQVQGSVAEKVMDRSIEQVGGAK